MIKPTKVVSMCPVVFLVLVIVAHIRLIHGFNTLPPVPHHKDSLLFHRCIVRLTAAKHKTLEGNVQSVWNSNPSRRNILKQIIYTATIPVISKILPIKITLAAPETTTISSLDTLLSEIKKARQQMNDVPELIKKEQWDSIRAILIKPPISDLWTKSARKTNLLQDYATMIGNVPSGDELAVLEAKEDVEGHLRFLDMAVYNNNFNPIKSEGETGATKELVRSYYEDPINEYKATIAALDNLIQLGNVN